MQVPDLDGIESADSHVDDSLDSLWGRCQDLAAVVDEDIEGLESMPEGHLVAAVEQPGDYVEHGQLVAGYRLGLLDEGAHHHQDILLVVVGVAAVQEPQQRHHGLLDFGDQGRDVGLVLSNVRDGVPAPVDGQLV